MGWAITRHVPPPRYSIMKIPNKYYRFDEVQKIRTTLVRSGYPRFQMFLLVTLTGLAGFLSSYLLLDHGFTQMWIRYLASMCIAYVVFLILLWLWLRTSSEDYVDIPDLSGFTSSHSSSTSIMESFTGSGGDFGGGGASASFDGPAFNAPIDLNSSSSFSPMGDIGDSVSQAVEAASNAEEFAIPLILMILIGIVIGALLISSSLVVYSAPDLFAELLLDGALSAGLYHKLRGVERRYWLTTALRKTAVSFIMTTLLISAAGFGMAKYAPEANSLGKVIEHTKQIHKKPIN